MLINYNDKNNVFLSMTSPFLILKNYFKISNTLTKLLDFPSGYETVLPSEIVETYYIKHTGITFYSKINVDFWLGTLLFFLYLKMYYLKNGLFLVLI